jgi:uncharacterized delta-60 repeat protein
MKKILRTQLLLLACLLLSRTSFGQLYMQDSTFKPLLVKHTYATADQVIVQPDQKILIHPGANYINDTEVKGLARLNPDGSLDLAFQRALDPEYYQSLALRPDGKILSTGFYDGPTGKSQVFVRLINANGQQDSTYLTGIPIDYPARKAFALRHDGHILLGANTYENDKMRGKVYRLTPKGTLDASFRADQLNATWVHEIIMQPDGKALILGTFTDPSTSVPRTIVRIHADGSIDTGFNPAANIPFSTRTAIVQPDGKILVALNLALGSVGGEGIVRLNPDGSRDHTFQVPTSGNTINAFALALLPNGQVLVSASYAHPDHPEGRHQVRRLNGNGSIDPTFVPTEGADHFIATLAVQADGKVLGSGMFTRYDGQVRAGLFRLGNTGAADPAFKTKLENSSYLGTVHKQADGKLLVSGGFDVANNRPQKYLTRLLPDGTVDPTFDVGSGAARTAIHVSEHVGPIALQADGKILVGGSFGSFNGQSTTGLVRLNGNGSVSNVFQLAAEPGYTVLAVVVQPDQKILVAGYHPAKNDSLTSLVRLLPDGRLDPGFPVGTRFTGHVNTVLLQPDGKIVAGGFFREFNGVPAAGIVRLNADGTLDASFSPAATGIAVDQVVLQPDGKFVVEGTSLSIPTGPNSGYLASKLARLHPDGRLDDAFKPTLGPYDYVETMHVLPGGQLLLAGGLRSYGRPLMLLNAEGAVNKFFYPLFFEQVQGTTQLLSTGTDLFVGAMHKLFKLNRYPAQIIAFDSIPDKVVTDVPFTLSARAASELPVTYQVVSGPASVAGNLVTLAGTPGTVTIRASQAGNDEVDAAPDVERTFRVGTVLGLETASASVKIHPNPAFGQFVVTLPAPGQIREIRLLNAQGKPVRITRTRTHTGFRIAVTDPLPGLYLLHLRLDEAQYVQKVVLR